VKKEPKSWIDRVNQVRPAVEAGNIGIQSELVAHLRREVGESGRISDEI
jgi:hypothetical protein